MIHQPNGLDLDSAIEFAVTCHRGQFRDGSDPLPYVTHPFEVANAVRYIGGVSDPVLLAVAYLHDTVESGNVSIETIKEKFGGEIAAMVGELTRSEPTGADSANLKKSEVWEMRSELLLADIRRMSVGAQTVKLGDRFCNLQDAFRLKKGKKLDRYLKQTRAILEIVPRSVNAPLWDSISKSVGRAG